MSDLIDRRLGRRCELVILKTSGDVHTGVSLAQLGKQLGEVGVFVKELERALLAREVDIAVHSLKDLPTDIPPGLAVACRPARVDVRDLLLVNASRAVPPDGGLPLRRGARVGTSSVRRRVLLLEQRPDLEMVTIRGNVPTRLDLARSGQLDAVVLAGAGIDRLGLDLTGVLRVDLPAERFVPAPGQGALAIEARADDADLLAQLATLDDAAAAAATDAERELLHGIGAGCSVPLGAHAVVTGARELLLRAALGPEQVAPGARPWIRRALVRAPDASAAARLGLQALGRLAPPRAPDAPRRLAGKRVLVLREPARAGELVQALEAEGASVAARPATQDRAVDGAAPALRAALAGAAWVAFASGSAVRHAVAALGATEGLRGKRLAAVGAATAAALAEHELPVDLVADEATGGGLAAALLARAPARPAVLLPCAQGGRPELKDALAEAGCAVTAVELYASAPLPAPSEAELAVDAIVVAAPSAARAALGKRPATRARLVAIGATTATALRELGLAATTAERPDAPALVEAVVRAVG